MDQNEEFAVAQLRQSVQEFGGSTEGFGDPTLMRFLIARSMDTGKAAKMFVQWQKWRATFVPHDRILESEIEDELSSNKLFLQGLTTQGHPLVIVKANRHSPAKDQLQLKKYVVYFLDKAIESGFRGKEVGNEKIDAIFELQGLSFKKLDLRSLINGFQFLQSYYPERLGKLYITDMPGFFVRIWKFVNRFLDKATQEKILIVTNDEEKREMIREIGEDTLPEEYGGRAKLILIQDVVLPRLNND